VAGPVVGRAIGGICGSKPDGWQTLLAGENPGSAMLLFRTTIISESIRSPGRTVDGLPDYIRVVPGSSLTFYLVPYAGIPFFFTHKLKAGTNGNRFLQSYWWEGIVDGTGVCWLISSLTPEKQTCYNARTLTGGANAGGEDLRHKILSGKQISHGPPTLLWILDTASGGRLVPSEEKKKTAGRH